METWWELSDGLINLQPCSCPNLVVIVSNRISPRFAHASNLLYSMLLFWIISIATGQKDK
jgi:hypothetical protein